MVSKKFKNIMECSAAEPLSKEDCIFVIREAMESEECRLLLFKTAFRVRSLTRGDTFYMTGGISSVLPCHLDPLCLYCPYWRDEDAACIPPEQIAHAAVHFYHEGIREFHLSGGTTLGSRGQDLLRIVERIHARVPGDMKITVNCGAAMDIQTMQRLKDLGVFKVGAVFETGIPDHFAMLKPGDSFAEKERFAWDIQKSGLTMHSGLMAGLGPAESRPEDYTESLYFLKQFPHMTSLYISKFRPDPSIPMRDIPACSLDEACILVAAARLVLRDVDIRIAAGWSPAEKVAGIRAGGGNELCVMMLNHAASYWKAPGQDTGTMEMSRIIDNRPRAAALTQKLGLRLV